MVFLLKDNNSWRQSAVIFLVIWFIFLMENSFSLPLSSINVYLQRQDLWPISDEISNKRVIEHLNMYSSSN